MHRLAFVIVGPSLAIASVGACSLLNAPDPVQQGGGGSGGSGGSGVCDKASDCPAAPGNMPCRVAVCGGDHQCAYEIASDGASCDDHDPCSTGETCSKGQCVNGAPTDCSSATTECGQGVCAMGVGCTITAIKEGIGCDMMNPCADSVCKAGRCSLTAPKNLGGVCDDGSNCTTADKCDATGKCVGKPKCTTTNQCSEATCDEASGMCGTMSIADGAPCEDGDACTGGETCTANACKGGTAAKAVFSDDFSTNKGWKLGPEWQIGVATASMDDTVNGADPAQDHTQKGDNKLAGVVIGGNATTTPHALSFMESPAIDVTGVNGKVFLTFYRWLDSDYTPYMRDVIEVNDGMNWHEIWTSGPQPPILDAPTAKPTAGPGWTFQSFDVTQYKNKALRVRFGLEVGGTVMDPALSVGSWNIDDVKVQNTPCSK